MSRVPKTNVQKTPKLQNLWNRHHEMIRMSSLGASNKQIAAELGVTPQNVSDVLCSEMAKVRTEVLQVASDSTCVDAKAMLQKEGPACVTFMTQVRDNEVPEVDAVPIALRARAASDLLDRIASTAKVRAISGTIENNHYLRGERLITLKENALKAKRELQDSDHISDAIIVEG